MNVTALIGYPLAALSAAMLLVLIVLQFSGVPVWWPLWPTFGLGLIVGVILLQNRFAKIV